MKIIRYISFWTNDKKQCWFEYQIQKDKNTLISVGAFGAYHQEAIRNAQNKLSEQFSDTLIIKIDFYDIDGIDIKSPMFMKG